MRTSWPGGAKLPAAILIEAVDRETHRVLVATRVSIEANADIGCLGGDDTNPTPAGNGAGRPAGSHDPGLGRRDLQRSAET